MCTQVVIARVSGDVFCDTIAQIRSALGGMPVMDEGYGEAKDDYCLCGVDLASTAKKYRLQDNGHGEGETWDMWYELRESAPPSPLKEQV